jgi:NADPH-dependent glutamate synthase beta subunit-like oxidoreductase
MSLFKPHHSLGKPKYAGSIISIDDRQPPFEYASGKRMWFYLGVDIASECFTTFVWGDTKESMIIEFYRQMVRNYSQWGLNLPYELECESSLNSSLKNGLLTPGRMFQEVRIEANNARGKYIERMNGKLRYEFEKMEAGWLARPHAKRESNQPLKQAKKQLTKDAIVELALSKLEQFNNCAHSEDATKTRWEYFLENQSPDLKPINWAGILPYIGYKTDSSCKAGIVKLQRGEYLLGMNGEISTGDDLISLMKQIEGENISIYWLDGNDGKVMKALAYIDNRLVCELLPKPIYNRAKLEQTADDAKARELMSKYAMTIEGFCRSELKKITQVTVIDNRTKELNKKFSIANLYRGAESVVEIENNDTPLESLEDLEMVLNEVELNEVETSFKSDLKDRF